VKNSIGAALQPQLIAFVALTLTLAACAHTPTTPPVCVPPGYEADHGEDGVHQMKFQDQTVYAYKNYYFTQAPAQNLAEFIKAHNVQLVVDLRSEGVEKDLPEGYPAVYWSHPLDDLSKLDYKNIETLEDHLETFADKTVVFVSATGDAAAVAFSEYWASENSLNDTWVTRTATALGLKDQAWLKKWDELEQNARSAASAAESESKPESD